MMRLDVGGNSIVLVNLDDQIHAYADACPHQRSRLSEGSLTGRVLRCTRHHWEFDVCTGQGINPQSACLKTLPVRIEGRDILVDADDERFAESIPKSENAR
jgi:toluene monooxygenase system ferredoxin subunit